MKFLSCIASALISALTLISSVYGLYEDQIHKFDWLKLHIGGVADAYLALNHFQPRLLVSTHEQVIASLCPKTGDILWRQLLEKGARGNLKLFKVSGSGEESTTTAAARPSGNYGFDLLTVQGYAPAIVRGWNTNTGNIEWEWSLMPLQSDYAPDAFWFYSNSFISHVLPVWGKHLEVTQYFATSGQSVGTTSKITATWINKDNCVVSGVYFVCANGFELKSLDLTNGQLQSSTLDKEVEQLKALEGSNGIVIANQRLISVNKAALVCDVLRSANFVAGNYNQRRIIAQADVINNLLEITAHYADDCSPIEELKQNLPYEAQQYGVPKLLTFDCKIKRNADGKSCLYIFDTSSNSMLAVQQNKLRWVREESLANIIATEFIELPLADAEGTLENEMKGKRGDITSAFIQRITTQLFQIKSLILHYILGFRQKQKDVQKDSLVRDAFGLHQMLIVLTESGKIFGIDNINGKQHWKQYLPNVVGFDNQQSMRLVVQRSSKHFPLQPICTLVARDALTGHGVLYRFNPITGRPIENGVIKLDYEIKQLSLLAETEQDFIKGLLLFDAQHKLHVYPTYAAPLANGLYMYTANIKNAELDGYFIKYLNGILTSTPIWNVRLAGHAGDHQIISVVGKNPIERVHSQGRVLGDRSVLYKYINPNLVAVFTQGTDSLHKYLLNLYLIDVVSGSVIFSMLHRRIRPPLHVVHSENWLAYSYYNDKQRRSEITAIELYEGKSQANNTVWSSLNAPPMPLIERQSYIVPTRVHSLRETITERGITNKHVLIGTVGGSIIEIPWALLDPRRPTSSSTQGREEGAIPYIPELPVSTENFINYNQTIARLNNIYTAPSGLESTCLVVATGLDMFVTRVAPSKTFDILKEDFDYILITIVLVVLTTGSLVVKHLASRKQLKQAWK